MILPDGIYLNLAPAIYRADPALGSTDLKALLSNPVQWHGRNRNPVTMEILAAGADPERQSKAAAGKVFGDALHVITLEGPDAFEDRYCIEPDRPPLPKTKEEIAEALKEIGVTPPRLSAKSIEFYACARLNGIKTAEDWDAERRIIVGERTAITKRWDTALRMLRHVLDVHPLAANYLSSGRAEVSIIWTDETGLRLKARFDYLRIRALIDLKTYAYREGMETIGCFVNAVEGLAYDFQAGHYMDARLNALPALVRAGAIYDAARVGETAEGVPIFEVASADDVAFLLKVAGEDKPAWVWVACLTMGVPEVDTVELPFDILAAQIAQSQVEKARENYRTYRARFGEDDSTLWVAERGLVRLTDFNFGRRSSDRGEVKWETDE